MKNLIATAVDEKYGDFVINHWYKSLYETNDLTNIDVLVIDYGLTESQLTKLTELGVYTYKGSTNGIVPNLRIIDLLTFFESNSYEKVVVMDGGDIIFQADISELFKWNEIRIAGHKYPFNTIFFSYYKNVIKGLTISETELRKILDDKEALNVGVMVGTQNQIVNLFQNVISSMKDLNLFMLEQIAINYYLYLENNFNLLPESFNFMYVFSKSKIKVEDGVIKYANGEIIPIVHNLGKHNYKRPFLNFGYGPNRNKLNKPSNLIIKTFMGT